MQTLNIDANLARPDDFYEMLIETHRDLSREDSELVNCKLILLLANHIGDPDVLRDAMRRARDGVGPGSAAATPPSGASPGAAVASPEAAPAASDDPTMPAIPSPS